MNVLTRVSSKNSQNEKQFYSKLTTGIQKMTNIENSLSKTVSILHFNVELNKLIIQNYLSYTVALNNIVYQLNIIEYAVIIFNQITTGLSRPQMYICSMEITLIFYFYCIDLHSCYNLYLLSIRVGIICI